MKDVFGEKVYPGCDRCMSRLEAFLMMFPDEQLNEMTRLTNINLEKDGKAVTTKGELVKFLGVMLLITRMKVKDRRKLWATQATYKYIPAMNLGRTGMSRHCYEQLWKAVRWSDQPETRPEGMSSERY